MRGNGPPRRKAVLELPGMQQHWLPARPAARQPRQRAQLASASPAPR